MRGASCIRIAPLETSSHAAIVEKVQWQYTTALYVSMLYMLFVAKVRKKGMENQLNVIDVVRKLMFDDQKWPKIRSFAKI